jgi:RimJ/RimL family protein N-acetyltransferase
MTEPRVRLRAVTEEDLPDYVRWLNDPEVTQFTQIESGGITLEGEREWFARISAPDSGTRSWAIEADGRHIGNCALGLDAAGQTAFFGIIIGDKTVWDRGCGTAALCEVLRMGFGEMGLHRIHLEAFAENGRAIRCYQKCGFRQEGLHRKARFKRGEWRDVVRMAMLREEWEAGEAAGVSTPALQGVEGARLRNYQPPDYARMMALWEASGWEPGMNDTEEVLRERAREPRGFLLVVEKEGQIIGTVMGQLDRRWGWIQRLAVHPEHRRQGIGRLLTQEAERRLAAMEAYRLVLLTRGDNPAAVGLYAGLGYETWEAVIVMSKRLEDAKEECCGSECVGDTG